MSRKELWEIDLAQARSGKGKNKGNSVIRGYEKQWGTKSS